MIKDVGEANVVQIVIDNGSAFMKVGKLLMKKCNLYCTPCAAHCINLMFEDISKRENVFDLITNARKITNFIYNYGWLLATMRKVCDGDIVRPRAKIFATNYITLASLLKKRDDLKKILLVMNGLLTSLVGRPLDVRLKDSCLIIHIGRRSLT